MRIKCMRIKTINLISSRKISGAQEEFGNSFFTILPCTYCFTGDRDSGEMRHNVRVSLPNWVRL